MRGNNIIVKSKSIDNMVIIGGSARSGTTIMGKLISSLKNIEYYFEPPMLESLLLKKGEISDASLKELLQLYFYDNFLIDHLAGRNINLNKNDDSCILYAKSQQEIDKRHEKTLTRLEIENISKNITFSFKLPEIVFLLDYFNEFFPHSRKVLMHRNPNDVINSIIKKQWFSDKFLHENHLSQLFSKKVVNEIKVPYWVMEEDEDFWVKTTELNRCAYYYIQISKAILDNRFDSIIVNYDDFVIKPKIILEFISDKLKLDITEKTLEVVSTVKYQDKKRMNYLLNIDKKLQKIMFDINKNLEMHCIIKNT